MADDSPGKVQALRAIFSEKNQPTMGMFSSGTKVCNLPRKPAVEVPEQSSILKERVNKEQTTQQQTKNLPKPPSTINDSDKTLNRNFKPAIGPKPPHLKQTLLSQLQHANSCDTSKDIENKSQTFSVSASQSKTVAETIASFMFSNGSVQKMPESSDTSNSVPSLRNLGKSDANNRLSLQENVEKQRKNCDSISSDTTSEISSLRNTIKNYDIKNELNNNCNYKRENDYTQEPCQTNSSKVLRNSAGLHNQTNNFCNLQKTKNLDAKDKQDILCDSDNYICKSSLRRKEVSLLGPPPPKPPRPPELVLPPKYRKFVSPKLLRSNVVNSHAQPPQIVLPHRTVPPKPNHPCPQRPGTPPPLPPIMKPNMSLREEIEELYEDTILSENRRPVSLIPEFTEEEELYNDADDPPEDDSLPPPLPPFSCPPPLPLKPKDPPPPCPPSEYLQPNGRIQPLEEELYQDADEGDSEEFYEVMPCDVIAEDPSSPVYSNNKKELEKLRREEEKRLRREQKEREKREKELEKLRKKFGLSGDEIPIDDGLVKCDSRGRNGDLPVRRGETVLILRMEGNPQGRWLVKNEKGKIGYVELTNIEVDPLSVKSVMTIRRMSVISASEELYCEAKSEEESIYEVTY